MQQRSVEWFEARKNRLTASSVGAVLGMDPFRNRDDVMRSMAREYNGYPSEFNGNVATEYGTYHEEGAFAEFQLDSGLKVDKCGFIPYEDWLGASPDGLIGEDAILEIKCPFGKRKDEAPDFKKLHDQPHYYAQVQIQLLCTGRNKAYFYQWNPYGTMTEEVYKDQSFLDQTIPVLRQFYAEYLHERDNKDHLDVLRLVVDTPDAHKAIQEWDELKEQIELAQERQKDLMESIVSMCNGKDSLIAGRKLTKVERAGSVSYAKVVKDHCKDVDLEPYRGKSSEFWRLT